MDLEEKFEIERQWWRDRLEWFIEWYRQEMVEFEDRLRDELTRKNDLQEKVKSIML